MKMVSAAKLRRAQERVIAARPYAAILQEMLANIAAAGGPDEENESLALLADRPENRIQLLLFTSDRGLAGAFNSNLIRAAQRFIEERPGAQVELVLIGRKGRDYFRRRTYAVTGEHLGILNRPTYGDARNIAGAVIERMRRDEIDAVYAIYNEFKSVISQKLMMSKILPVARPSGGEQIDYILEETPQQLLGVLLPRYVEVRVLQAMLETAAAEHAARMTAMDAASSNAADVIDKLTLYMNRVRQASITREIIEVVSGSAALE
jgi:F-type H+-transporting ATPase subunit gamma